MQDCINNSNNSSKTTLGFCIWHRFKAVRLHSLACLCLLVLTLAMTWPLLTRLDTHVTPGQQPVMTVPYLNLWTLAWNHHWLNGEAESYWDANLFHPHRKTLGYSEPQFGMALLTSPLVFLGANTVLAYNLILLGFLWGSGMAVYALCWYLFKGFDPGSGQSNPPRIQNYRWAAALTAGMLYGFNFYIFFEIGVLQLIATLFPPLALLGLHRFLDDNKWTDAFLFCLGFLGSWYTCSYYGLFLSVFIPCFVIKYGLGNIFRRETLFRSVLTVVVTLLGLVPLAVGMQSAKTAMSLSRPKFVVQNLSAALSNYLKFPENSWLYGKILGIGSPEGRMFLGGLLMGLAGLAIIVIFTARLTKNPRHPISRGIRHFPKRYGGFYTAMAGLAFWLSCGMALTPADATGLGIYRIIVWLSPYNLLYQFIPGFSSIRSPYRFLIFCVLFLAVLAGYGILWLSQRIRTRWRPLALVLIVAVVILELWPLPLRLVKVPENIHELPSIYAHVRNLPSKAPLLELPLARGFSEQELETEARSMYFSTFHWMPLISGYSGFIPRANIEMKQIIDESTPETVISAFRTFGIEYILTHEQAINENERHIMRTLEGNGLLRLVDEGSHRLYQVIPNPINEKKGLPDPASFTFYESRSDPGHVTLCLYYEMNPDAALLTTPWRHRVECQISWYAINQTPMNSNDPSLDTPQHRDAPDYTNVSVARDSKLITKSSNAIEIDTPAPPPGEYRVVVQERVATRTRTMTGHCRVYKGGFIDFKKIS